MDVSRLVLGTMYLGGGIDERTSRALLERFVGTGGRTLDTASCYAFRATRTDTGSA